MQKTKKQKYEQQIRKSLKTIINLDPEMAEFLKNLPLKNQTILSRTYSKLHQIQLLRTLTLIQINFIIFAFLDILEKTKAIKIENLKIGIIGGGIMGRLILNTLLIFTKQGLKASNILVSTRQPHHLQFYVNNFGIQTFFDNDKIAQQAHLIFVATPATIDNWIILDLKNQIQKTRANIYPAHESTRNSEASTVVLQNSGPSGQSSLAIRNSLEKQRSHTPSKRVQMPLNSENLSINPFVYILTSDFTYQKSKKLFNFPVYVPHIRAQNLSSIVQKLQKHFQNIEISQLFGNSDKLIKQIQTLIVKQWFKQLVPQNSQEEKVKLEQSSLISNIIKVLDFSFRQLESNWKKGSDFSKIKNSVQSIQNHKLYKDVLNSQGSYGETFQTKSRKWRMAYNNFIA